MYQLSITPLVCSAVTFFNFFLDSDLYILLSDGNYKDTDQCSL